MLICWSVGSWLHPSLISPGVQTGATTSQPKSKWRSYNQNSVGNKTGQSPRLLKNHKVCFNMIEASFYPFLPPSRKRMLIKCAAATHPTSNNHWTVTWLKATTFWEKRLLQCARLLLTLGHSTKAYLKSWGKRKTGFYYIFLYSIYMI